MVAPHCPLIAAHIELTGQTDPVYPSEDMMPVKEPQAHMASVDTSAGQQVQDLPHAGALHDHASSGRIGSGRHGLKREPRHPNVSTNREQISSPVKLVSSLDYEGNAMDGAMTSKAAHDTRAIEQGQYKEYHGPGSWLENASMQRWYSEEAHEQPWTPARLEEGAASGEKEKK
jgi:hypothetical protein